MSSSSSIRSWVLAFAVAGFGASAVGRAGPVEVPGGTLYVGSLVDARFEGAKRQQFDFSCGAAAVATLLTYQYGRPTEEGEVFEQMWRSGDRAKIRQVGFSLLDMKRFLEAHGFEADGFRVSLEDLRAEQLPAIALIVVSGYSHFVVIRGINDTHVLVADSAFGLRSIERVRFERQRSDILLVVRNHVDRARALFSTDVVHVVGPRAPLRSTGPLGDATLRALLRPGRNEF